MGKYREFRGGDVDGMETVHCQMIFQMFVRRWTIIAIADKRQNLYFSPTGYGSRFPSARKSHYKSQHDLSYARNPQSHVRSMYCNDARNHPGMIMPHVIPIQRKTVAVQTTPSVRVRVIMPSRLVLGLCSGTEHSGGAW
jgi:hypothetical protein